MKRIMTLVLALGALSSCTKAPPKPPPTGGQFVPFAEFLKRVRTATFADYAKREGSRVRDSAAFEEMRQHILTMYDGVKQVSTFVVGDDYFDCITVETQPSLRLRGLREPAPAPKGSANAGYGGGKPPGEVRAAPSPLTEGLTDRFGNKVSCPKGSIPMERLTLERLTRYETLRQFFSKDGKGGGALPPESGREQKPEGESTVHKYAAGRQSISNFGGNSWLNLWNPAVADKNHFSLSQQWYASGSGDSVQTVEGGWQVYENKYSTKKAVLFIYWTADGYGSTGCYNLDCTGFVQINGNWYLAGPWSQYSTSGGTQWGFEMQWKYFRGNWWLFLRGPGSYEAVGYYPGSQYNGGQMSRSATRATYGGEVTGTTTWPEMGSGQFANQGWQKAAFHHTIFYIPRDEDDGTGVWASLSAIQPSPKCYTVNIVSAPDGGSWGTYLYFGGPGGSVCE